MHANLVRTSLLRLDRFGKNALDEFESTMTIWGLEHGDLGVVSIKSHGCIGPLDDYRVTADIVRPRSVKESTAASMSQTVIPTFSNFMVMR